VGLVQTLRDAVRFASMTLAAAAFATRLRKEGRRG
jgi:hypothetical protein